MEFDIFKDKPPSTRKLLNNQVKEQSDVCDVTIRRGLWEKKFHWCVLVASPFFEKIRRHSYQERESGIISMAIGTPLDIEEAILFLYGRKPEMNSTNVAGLIELAEYLIMPVMKRLCVQWIDDAKVTDETCMTMIKLSSLYEFPLPTYEMYLRGRLAELIHTDDMMDLDEESVVDILDGTDITSYVKASDLFTFIVRWIRCRQSRKPLFEKMMGLVDFRDIDGHFVTDVIMKEPLVKELDASSSFIRKLETVVSSDFCDVLIFPDKCVDHEMPCLDMNKRKWRTLITHVGDGPYEIPKNRSAASIRSVRGKDHPEVYLHSERFSLADEIYVLNLEDNSVKLLEVNEIGKEDKPRSRGLKYRNVFVKRNDLVKTCNEYVAYGQGNGSEGRQPGAKVNMEKKQMTFSVLKIGKIENGAATITPVLSIKGDVSNVCANESTVMMLQKNKEMVYLYNKEMCSLEAIDLKEKKIDLNIRCDVDCAEINDDFIIYGTTYIVMITKNVGPCLSNKYLIKQYNIGPSEYRGYYFCAKRWYRYCSNPPSFQFTTHDRLLAAVQCPIEDQDGVWEDIPVLKTKFRQKQEPGPRIFQVKIRKERLLCALGCPHCQQRADCKQREESERWRTRNFNTTSDSPKFETINLSYDDENIYYDYPDYYECYV